MKISLKDLRAAPGQKLYLPFQESIDGLDLNAPIKGDILLTASSTSIKLAGKVLAAIRLLCHRCLSSFQQLLDLDLDEEFVYEDYLNIKTLSGKDRELQKEDFFETIAYEDTIDVSDVIYQAVLLAIPSYNVCGPNCLGIPIYKGTKEKNIAVEKTQTDESTAHLDPRWHNLKTILLNEAQNKKVRDNS